MLLLSLFLYSCLLLTAFNAATRINISSTNFLSNVIDSFLHGPNAINITRFLSTFQLPTCMRECVPEIDGLLMALSRTNDSRDFLEICSELQSSTYCASSSGCSKVFTDAVTSAFQFVCLDNIQAISESIKCIKNTAVDVQPECEAHCVVESPNVNESFSDNNLWTAFQVEHVCNSTRCLLTCFKTRIGNKCRIGHRNVLDSLLSAVIRGENTGDALDWIMPDSCQLKNIAKQFPIPSTNTPPSVGQVVPDHITAEKYDTTKETGAGYQPLISVPPNDKLGRRAGTVEAVLLVDGQLRNLRYQMFDWQGNPVPPPDLQTLSKILMVQPLFLTFSSERFGETFILPSEEDDNETTKHHRAEPLEEPEKEENFVSPRSRKKNEENSKAIERSFNDKTEAIHKKRNVANQTVCISVHLAVLSVTVSLWINKNTWDNY